MPYQNRVSSSWLVGHLPKEANSYDSFFFKVIFFFLFRLADEEQKKAAAQARSLKHKQKVYGNPELHEAYRKKERERYTAA